MEGLAIFGEAKDLNLLLVCHHYSFPVELERLSEAFDASLREADKLMLNVDSRLEKRCHWSSLHDFDLDLFGFFLQADRECRLVVGGQQGIDIILRLRSFM